MLDSRAVEFVGTGNSPYLPMLPVSFCKSLKLLIMKKIGRFLIEKYLIWKIRSGTERI